MGLAAVAMLLGGCVYLRLLALKNQFADFEDNFGIQTDEGLRLSFLNPVLLDDDIRWLGLLPEKIERLGDAERWTVRWVKQRAAGSVEADPHDIEVDFMFGVGKLTRVYFPERYFGFVPKPLFIAGLRSLGGAKVDQANRSMEARLKLSREELLAGRPTLQSLAQLLGEPTERREEGMQTIVRYLYTPSVASSRSGVFDMTFVLETDSGELKRLQGRTPIGRVAFEFPPLAAESK